MVYLMSGVMSILRVLWMRVYSNLPVVCNPHPSPVNPTTARVKGYVEMRLRNLRGAKQVPGGGAVIYTRLLLYCI